MDRGSLQGSPSEDEVTLEEVGLEGELSTPTHWWEEGCVAEGSDLAETQLLAGDGRRAGKWHSQERGKERSSQRTTGKPARPTPGIGDLWLLEP